MGHIKSISGIIASAAAVAVLGLVAPIAHAQYTTVPPNLNSNYSAYATGPSAYTNMAVNVTDVSATLSGTVYPNGFDTVAWFQYGESSILGHSTPAQDVGSVYSMPGFTAVVSNLYPTTTYYYRLVAENAFGTSYGTIQTFNTLNYYSSYSAPNGTANPGAVTGLDAPATPSIPSNVNSTLNSVLGSMNKILLSMKTMYNDSQTAQGSEAPSVAVAVTKTSSFTLKSTVSPNGSNTIAWFEYGSSTSLGYKTNAQNVGSGTAVVPVSATLTGLTPNTTYYYRVVGSNAYGSNNGPVLTFVTGNGTSNIAGQGLNDYTASILSSLNGSWTIIGLIILVLIGAGVVIFLRFVLK
ncbi:MAG: fibronectin type III domain-containing protein [Patescibacteria group bacterium]|nr:fibronectin type III domain-containing protein [Patescibacteria group bacterium]MCL5224384.1 fibronectin type III domain-containing protein [Patescibacteria group bacterium]